MPGIARLPDFWKCLEQRISTASPLARWRRAAGSAFAGLRPFLVPTGTGAAPVFPCPDCGRDLIVVPSGTGYGAEPEEDSPCASIPTLDTAEVEEYRLRGSGVIHAIATALDCALTVDVHHDDALTAYGQFVRESERYAARVLLSCNTTKLLDAGCRWLAEVRDAPSLFFTCTHHQACANLFAPSACTYLALEDLMGINTAGELSQLCDPCVKMKPVPASSFVGAQAKAELANEIRGLKTSVDQSLGEKVQHWQASAEKQKTIEKISEGPDHFLAGLRARMAQMEWETFLLWIHAESIAGTHRHLTMSEMAARLKISRQAVHKRITALSNKHADAYDYGMALRTKHQNTVAFSEMSPSERRAKGIEAAYNYDQG